MNSAATLMLGNQRAAATLERGREARVTKGRPLIMLGLLTGSWVLARTILWETPLPQVPRALGTMTAQIFAANTGDTSEEQAFGDLTYGSEANVTAWSNPNVYFGAQAQAQVASANAPLALLPTAPLLPPASDLPIPASDLQTAASHQLMWMAAMAYMPVPAAVQSAFAKANPVVSPPSGTASYSEPFAITRKTDADRWSLDAWSFWRQGSASPLISLGQSPSYGASQAGAVLRYELQPSNARRPRAYVRAYSSLEGRTEQEIAAGLSVKPLPKLPVRLHAEARALRSASGAAGNASGRPITARAAAFVTTELPPAKLPAGFTAEAYGQAGYVTGKNSTAFADGQAHILREVASFDLAKIEVGGAAFAGAQKGAHRVDIGPAMRVNLSLGETPARLSASYRAKIAGDAQPGSGVAVTLSTRF